MPRDLVIGNGCAARRVRRAVPARRLLLPARRHGEPSASPFRFGIWADGRSLGRGRAWRREITYLRDTLVGDVTCEHADLGNCVSAATTRSTPTRTSISARSSSATSATRSGRSSSSSTTTSTSTATPSPTRRTTIPQSGAIIHYKAKRYLLINSDAGTVPEYACGRSGIGGAEGTWRDAEDGALSMEPIAQGAVDSTIGIPCDARAARQRHRIYWICAGKRYGEVRELDRRVREETPARMMARTASYWYTWVNKNEDSFGDLPDETRGALSAVAARHRDAVRPQRRGSSRRTTPTSSGATTITTRTCGRATPRSSATPWTGPAIHGDHAPFPRLRDEKIITRTAGSSTSTTPTARSRRSWHPWVRDGKPQLPIQEDETALVDLARWRGTTSGRATSSSCAAFTAPRRAAGGVPRRLPRSGDRHLPMPSFDIWEERQGVFTFTCAAVIAGLEAASTIAKLFNDAGAARPLRRGGAGDTRRDVAAPLRHRREALRARDAVDGEGAGARSLPRYLGLWRLLPRRVLRRRRRRGVDDARRPREARGPDRVGRLRPLRRRRLPPDQRRDRPRAGESVDPLLAMVRRVRDRDGDTVPRICSRRSTSSRGSARRRSPP